MSKQGKILESQGGCFCRTEKRRGGLKQKTSPFICECGYRVRGKDHTKGSHHNHTVVKCRRGKW